MRALTAIVATVIGVVTWATARAVRRYEDDLADRRAYAAVDDERIVRIEAARLAHPSNRGKS